MARGICKVCQRFFEKTQDAQIKCRACDERDEADYVKVRTYLERHERSSTSDVIKDTGVSLRTLERFIEERRVYVVNDAVKTF